MATGQGAGADHLSRLDRLAADPSRFHIFLALRLIEAQHADAPRLGAAHRPRQDRVRLGMEPSMAFARSSIHAFTPATGARPGKLTNRFFGLFGPQGPLPPHLTEYARERQRNHRDPTFTAFADMLTHRPMSLLYRAWTTGQPAPDLDRGNAGGQGSGRLERKVAALAGYNADTLHGRDAMPDMARRYFTGHLARGPKSAAGLEAMLSGFFAAPVRVQQFISSWLELEPDDRWQLGKPAALGQTTSIGSRVHSRAAKFRIRIGPLSLSDYRALLPGGAALDRLTAIVRSAVGDALDWDVNLVLRGADVPRAQLGSRAKGAQQETSGAEGAQQETGTRLGQTSWIGTRKGAGDAGDMFVSPLAMLRNKGAEAPQGGITT